MGTMVAVRASFSTHGVINDAYKRLSSSGDQSSASEEQSDLHGQRTCKLD